MIRCYLVRQSVLNPVICILLLGAVLPFVQLVSGGQARAVPVHNSSAVAEGVGEGGRSVWHDVTIGTHLKGGLGNQINCLMQTMALARKTRSRLVLPLTASRFPQRRYREASNYPLLPSTLYWDTPLLARISQFSVGLPQACGGRIDIYYFLSRSRTNHGRPPVLSSVPHRALLELCHHAGQRNRSTISKHCTQRVLGETVFAFRHTPAQHGPGNALEQEIFDLHRGRLPVEVLEAPRAKQRLSALTRENASGKNTKVKRRSMICVFVDGLPYNREGIEGVEYFYSYMHYYQPSKRVLTEYLRFLAAHKIDTQDLTVLHLRYDEHLCVNGLGKKQGQQQAQTRSKLNDPNSVCVRFHLTIKHHDVVRWLPVGTVVHALRGIMRKERSKTFYLTASPYAPQRTVDRLLGALNQGGVTVVPPIDDDAMDHETLNLVEREIAIRAKTFIGDYASTWSTSVFYKRRTLSKHTYWCLGLCRPEHQFTKMNHLPGPKWFEAKRALGFTPLSVKQTSSK